MLGFCPSSFVFRPVFMANASSTPKSPTLANQAARAVLWNTVFVPLRLATEVLATLVKLNLLTQASYGLLALISGANNGLGTGIDLGTTRALPKFIPETSQRGGPQAVLRLLTAVFAAQLMVLLLLGGGLVLASQPYLDNLRGLVLRDVTLSAEDQLLLLDFIGRYGPLIIGAILALLLLGVCYDMCMAYLNSFFKQRAWNSIALAAGLLPQLLSAGAILAGWDILGVLGAMVLAPTLAVALAGWQVWVAWQSTGDRGQGNRETGGQAASAAVPDSALPLATPPASAASGLASLSGWLPPGFVRYAAVSFLMTATDYFASASFAIFLARDIRDVAVLTAGTALAKMALGYLYTPMVGLQVPLFTRVRAGEGGTVNGAYQSLARLQSLLIIPGGVGLLLLTEPALLVVSPNYLSAAPLVWVLVPCLFLECLLTTAHNALIVYEHLGIIIISRLLTLLTVAVLALILPNAYGLLGLALAFGLARIVAGLWVTANGYRLLGLRWPWRFTARVLGATATMALLVFLVRGLLPPLPTAASLLDRLREAVLLLVIAAIGGAGFFVALRVLGGLDQQDRAQLAKMKLPLKRWIMKMV
jgi:O-antigen/teichoic acid export membrane protein